DTAALFGAASGAKGLILNDAGGGKNAAGTAGLAAVEPYGVAAATIDYRSARIGNGPDTWQNGVISRCNRWAAEVGVEPGQSVQEAARRLAVWPAQPGFERPETPADRPPMVIAEGPPRVLALDSASMVDQSHVGAIVITGSHGGMTGGRAVRAAVAAAFFNDAGVGKEDAGISRLPLLDKEGIPGGTVDRNTAVIGDGWDTYESGILSHVNQTARGLALEVGMPLRRAVEILVERLR
ncbi:MAG TPA: hypothetical protein VHL09_14550, partial [Dehalococcoidia bacterium]|nr:hypothetical protein [Dehalococcoidia bacterium]